MGVITKIALSLQEYNASQWKLHQWTLTGIGPGTKGTVWADPYQWEDDRDILWPVSQVSNITELETDNGQPETISVGVITDLLHLHTLTTQHGDSWLERLATWKQPFLWRSKTMRRS